VPDSEGEAYLGGYGPAGPASKAAYATRAESIRSELLAPDRLIAHEVLNGLRSRAGMAYAVSVMT